MGKDKIRKFVAAVDIRHLQLYEASSGTLFIHYNQGHQIPRGGRHVKPTWFSSGGYGCRPFLPCNFFDVEIILERNAESCTWTPSHIWDFGSGITHAILRDVNFVCIFLHFISYLLPRTINVFTHLHTDQPTSYIWEYRAWVLRNYWSDTLLLFFIPNPLPP